MYIDIEEVKFKILTLHVAIFNSQIIIQMYIFLAVITNYSTPSLKENLYNKLENVLGP